MRHTNRSVLVSLLALTSLGLRAETGTMPQKLLFYKSPVCSPLASKLGCVSGSAGDAAIAEIRDGMNVVTLTDYLGALSPWTHVVGDDTDLFFYNTNGAAAVGRVDWAGAFTTTASLGGFSPWSDIVRYKGYLFFYNAKNDVRAAGELLNGSFRQFPLVFPEILQGTTSNWSLVVGTPNGIILYDTKSGGANVLNLVPEYSSQGGGFPVVADLKVQQTGVQWLSPGWTHIVSTSNGLLFYNSDTGLHVMADLLAGGKISTRTNTVQTLRKGWTHIVAVNDDILFYERSSGDMAVGGILGLSKLNPQAAGSLEIRAEYSAFLSPGWTHIVRTYDPPQVH